MRLILFLIAGLLFFQLTVEAQVDSLSKNSTAEMKLDNKNSLDLNTAREMVDRYRKKRWRRMRRVGPVGYRYDGGSAWFCIDKLREFEESVNRYLQANSSDTSKPRKVSGFRFYYMMYKKNDPNAPTELKKYLGKRTKKIHSLLIVATELTTMDCELVHTDIIDTSTNKIVAMIMNEGTLCPPLPLNQCKGATLARDVYPFSTQ